MDELSFVCSVHMEISSFPIFMDKKSNCLWDGLDGAKQKTMYNW